MLEHFLYIYQVSKMLFSLWPGARPGGMPGTALLLRSGALCHELNNILEIGYMCKANEISHA
jgi:hypothetical protein